MADEYVLGALKIDTEKILHDVVILFENAKDLDTVIKCSVFLVFQNFYVWWKFFFRNFLKKK